MRSGHEMVRTNTSPVVAKMIDRQTIGDRRDEVFVRYAVRHKGATVNRDLPVSAVVERSHPDPAVVTDRDSIKESPRYGSLGAHGSYPFRVKPPAVSSVRGRLLGCWQCTPNQLAAAPQEKRTRGEFMPCALGGTPLSPSQPSPLTPTYPERSDGTPKLEARPVRGSDGRPRVAVPSPSLRCRGKRGLRRGACRTLRRWRSPAYRSDTDSRLVPIPLVDALEISRD